MSFRMVKDKKLEEKLKGYVFSIWSNNKKHHENDLANYRRRLMAYKISGKKINESYMKEK